MHKQLNLQQFGRTRTRQILIKAAQLTFVLNRIPNRNNGLAHTTDGVFQRLRATLHLVELFKRRIDQHQPALFCHRQQRTRHMPAFTQMHRYPAITLHVVFE